MVWDLSIKMSFRCVSGHAKHMNGRMNLEFRREPWLDIQVRTIFQVEIYLKPRDWNHQEGERGKSGLQGLTVDLFQ